MTDQNLPSKSAPARLNARQRRNYGGAGVLLLSLLGVAGLLTPDPSGMGTHQQLGLPACTFETILGARCPTCGMTTSWSHLMHGELTASLDANAGGTCLAMVTVLGGGWAVAVALRGVAGPRLPRGVTLATVLAIAAITLVDWAFKLLP